VVDNNKEDKNEADLSSKGAGNPNNVSTSKNQSYFVAADSSQNGGKDNGLENNKMAYNYTSYRVSNDSLHNSQQQTKNPNDVISSYLYSANSSQGAIR
jgi:hypothetical protein